MNSNKFKSRACEAFSLFLKDKKNNFITLSVFAIFLAFDIITKYLVEKHIALHERIDILFGSFFQFTKIYNRGGVFGIFQGYQKVFLIISILVFFLLAAFYISEKNKTKTFCFSLGLIFSGAIGNIIDRISGRPGVVDFLYIGVDGVYRWPAFNIADSSIVVGMILLLLSFYKQEKQKKLENK